ncbi:type II toxin-antitoxin system VapB family antitoxin [Vibrio sp. WXL103]|uniref:type II toxin-antitoxin system VapB family antitoxin n=1 Tax=unclassified Vibrio TaxID=2614977 RepID=UPI003EC555A7
MKLSSLFLSNQTQCARIPSEYRFEGGIKKVTIRQVGSELILSPIDSSWNSFFYDKEVVSEDFNGEPS